MRRPYEIEESPLAVRVGEGALWQLDTTLFGGSPVDGSASVKVTNALGVDVTASVMPGGCTVYQNLIFLPPFLSVNPGIFTLTVQFTNPSLQPARPFATVEVSN